MGTLLRTTRNTTRQITTPWSPQSTRRTPYTMTTPTLSCTYHLDACRHAYEGHWRRLALPARAHHLWHLDCTSTYSCTSRFRQVAVHRLLHQHAVFLHSRHSAVDARPKCRNQHCFFILAAFLSILLSIRRYSCGLMGRAEATVLTPPHGFASVPLPLSRILGCGSNSADANHCLAALHCQGKA